MLGLILCIDTFTYSTAQPMNTSTKHIIYICKVPSEGDLKLIGTCFLKKTRHNQQCILSCLPDSTSLCCVMSIQKNKVKMSYHFKTTGLSFNTWSFPRSRLGKRNVLTVFRGSQKRKWSITYYLTWIESTVVPLLSVNCHPSNKAIPLECPFESGTTILLSVHGCLSEAVFTR